MTTISYTLLPNRGVIAITGEEAKTFLQGLISNDINKVSEKRAIYSAFLTPQGKYLYDFFIIEKDGTLYLEMEADHLPAFLKKLKMYKLKSRVDLTDVSNDFEVIAIWGDGVPNLDDGILFADPRHPKAGFRALLPNNTPTEFGHYQVPFSDYDDHRLELGLADGTRDLVQEKSILLENGFDELNGVDWEKGCYMGQELTARTKYRGLIKKRLLPVKVEGPLPEAGTQITQDGKDAGEVRSGLGNLALALVRLDALKKDSPLVAGDATLTAEIPDWVVLPEETES